MSNTVKVIIANKRRIGISQGAITFTTGGYGGKVFNIPHSQIENRTLSQIVVSDTHTEMATEYEITKWIFGKIKEDLESMESFNAIIPK